MAVRIICVKKHEGKYENPYVAIDHLEWINERTNIKGVTSLEKIHDWIKNENGEAYLIDSKGNKLTLIPAISPQGNKYVKTDADETTADALLLMPVCG